MRKTKHNEFQTAQQIFLKQEVHQPMSGKLLSIIQYQDHFICILKFLPKAQRWHT